ncbi:hypothetical protein DFH08DRAFT_1080690 [Mycena albidolilacea]|uniref:Transmembrane protein n=1 Tax=Mycena albidolilacea TaxID=1033008 RepID=A0AAD7ERG2_9AGAR|nr:hypothetical protein DFH08DRAFT_1080690 [Mycena albidolilacea]
MSGYLLLLLAVFLPVFAEECIDSATPCSTSRSPLKVFATFSALLVLVVAPFLICALVRRRKHTVPPGLTPSRVPASYTPPFWNSGLHEAEAKFKAPQLPPPSYSPA